MVEIKSCTMFPMASNDPTISPSLTAVPLFCSQYWQTFLAQIKSTALGVVVPDEVTQLLDKSDLTLLCNYTEEPMANIPSSRTSAPIQ